jgi:hypothetical protein
MKLKNNRLELLLESSFPYIRFEVLRDIPLTVMAHLDVIPKPFLEILAQHKQIYEV